VKALTTILTIAVLLGIGALALVAWPPQPPTVNYHVEQVDGREVIVVCTNGAQPFLVQSLAHPTAVSIKCMDLAKEAK